MIVQAIDLNLEIENFELHVRSPNFLEIEWKISTTCGCDRAYEMPIYFKFSNLLFKILNFEKRNYIFNNNK